MKKPEYKAKTRAERSLLQAFRRLESKHERQAVLVLLTSVAWGRLNKDSNRKSLRSVLGPF